MTTIPQHVVLRSVDVPTRQRIADLRREIEGIRQLNAIYLSRGYHKHADSLAHEMRLVRLEEIKHQLAALRSKQMS